MTFYESIKISKKKLEQIPKDITIDEENRLVIDKILASEKKPYFPKKKKQKKP
jgi:hypothetical protein